MKGIRVIECAEYTFVPAAATLLADWGADVIKIERATGGGDSSRHMLILQQPGQDRNGFFEVANRGKRGIALDLTTEEGRAILHKQISETDVFVTSLRKRAQEKMGITPELLTKLNPKLIYARGTGYGLHGPLANAPGFDHPTAWCRAGAAFAQDSGDGTPPPMHPSSVGDLTGGVTLAGAIAAALFRRERTGKGAIVDHSLYSMGTYLMTQSLTKASLAQLTAEQVLKAKKAKRSHPLVHPYATQDSRFLQLCFLQDAWFSDLAKRIEREDLLDDPRFEGEKNKMANAQALIDELQSTFSRKTLDEWCDILADCKGAWAPHFGPTEVLADEQALSNGFVTPVHTEEGEDYFVGATPGQFDEQPLGELNAAPHWGQHTDQVLSEWGVSNTDITSLKKKGLAHQL